jgi:SagB-type dehydrogenase family enzyme
MASGSIVRKRLSVLVSLALLAAVVMTFSTGFIAAALDLNRFVYHKYAAYVAIGFALVHVVLHWRSLLGQIRRWLLRMSPPVSPGVVRRGEQRVSEEGAPALSRRRLLWPGVSLLAGLGLGSWAAGRATPPVPREGDDLGQIYHQWSKPTYSGLLRKSLHVGVQPSPYKEYPGVPKVALPAFPEPAGPPLEQVIKSRRSVREYADRQVTLAELSRLLHYSTGVTDRRDPTLAFRSVPSSGALFPIEVYPVVFDVGGLAPGVYHYGVAEHQLSLLREGNFRREVFQAALSQEMILRASLVLVLTGLHERVQWKYVDRSYRYLMLEAGHLGQNVYLAATGMGLGPCGIGAYFDDDLNRLLGVDGHEEATVYLLAIGAA